MKALLFLGSILGQVIFEKSSVAADLCQNTSPRPLNAPCGFWASAEGTQYLDLSMGVGS